MSPMRLMVTTIRLKECLKAMGMVKVASVSRLRICSKARFSASSSRSPSTSACSSVRLQRQSWSCEESHCQRAKSSCASSSKTALALLSV